MNKNVNRISPKRITRYYKERIDQINKQKSKYFNSMETVNELVQNLAEKSPTNVGEGITIIPAFEMGDGFDSWFPLLTAQVQRNTGSHIDESSFRVIVDGILYTPEYDSETDILSLQITETLLEKFHVVTFEGANHNGTITRETRIFYIQDQE